jgi:hypothetical protein
VAPSDPNFGPPDFVGVGAQRSGTTWWFRLLLEHPKIKRPARQKDDLPPFNTAKELHFFNQFCGRPMLDEDVAAYHRQFPRRPGKITGEWTPRYMYDPWTPRLLARAALEAKILVLLRDPIERYRSGTLHQVHFTPQRGQEKIAVDAVNRGYYAAQLRRLWTFFDREQVLVLQYERCREDPLGQYARTLRFLGVRDDFVPEEVERPRGRSTQAEKEPLWPEMLEDLRTDYERDVREVAELVPDLDLSLWPNFDGSAP